MIQPKNHPTGYLVPNHHEMFKHLPEILAALGADDQVNIYYTLAHHAELGRDMPSRSAQTFEYQTVLPFDLDYIDTSRPFEYLACVARVLVCDPAHLTLVCTGNGLHVLAHLKTSIRSAKYQKQLKPAFNRLCLMIRDEIIKAGLPFDESIGAKLDPVVFDAGRVFRLPGTTNRKPDQADKACELLQYSEQTLAIDMEALSGIDKLQKENVTPEQIQRQYPKPDFQEVVKECRFVAWALEKPGEIHEPQVFDLFSLLGAMPPTAKIAYQGREMSAREVGQSVMENASASKSCQRQDFDRKWEDSSRYGARKCSTIGGNVVGICETCPHSGRIPTPLALKSPGFVSSDDVGFWVMGSKGQYLHPHYSDLSKVYAQETTFVTTAQERLFVYTGSHYIETTPLMAKAWLEKKVTPPDPLREMHRNEFVRKIAVVGAMTPDAENELFNGSILGKLNCKNGVIDILKGDLIPHNPKMGFQYVLPYDFDLNTTSEFFIDWLAEVMQNRDELMDALLDMMAYCLWPTYDDHVFCYLTGEGANGKGTLLHILQALLGKDNFTSVSIPQLGQNRFAPAALEGKLANLSEESSGYEMSFEEMNIIKNLSAGGEIFAERKGVQGFTFHNRAKMIFSANKTPRFKEQGHAIRRRLLVIPFDHTFSAPDPRIEKQLLEDVPGICALLVRRIQENVKANGGRFLVSRGGAAAHEAQEKVLLQGNSVVEWANEKLESSLDLPKDTYVPVTEAFQNYTHWCFENNYRPANKGAFGANMTNLVLSKAAATSVCKKINDKVIRVYTRTRFKENDL